MDWIIFVSILWLLSYSTWIFWLHLGFVLSPKKPCFYPEINQKKGVSVLIPIRNEAENVELLIHSLKKQSYPAELVEYVFIDDHSTDESLTIFQNAFFDEKNFFIYQLPLGKQGKKSALSLGVEKSCFDYILTTDADCLHPINWVETMINHHMQNQAVFTAGLVTYSPPKNVLESFIYFESVWLNTISSALYFRGYPIIASGANLLFSKQAFNEVGGYQKHEIIPSGDDIFLLHDMKTHFPIDKIQCISSPETLVQTNYPTGLKEFIHQRLRWAQKTKYYTDEDSLMIGSFTAILSFTYMILFFVLMMHGFLEFLCFTFIKIALDLFIVRKSSLGVFLVFFAGLIYPIYSLGILIWAYIGNLSWKDRVMRL